MGTLWNRAHVRHRLARMKSSNVLIVVIVAYASTLAVSGQTIVDVRQPINLELIDSFKHFLHSSLMMAPQLAFIDKDRLAVSFLNPCSGPAAEPPPRLKKREEENMPCVLTLTVLLLDTKSGQVEDTLTFPFHSSSVETVFASWAGLALAHAEPCRRICYPYR
jgi:hypothetical protein